jgi:hypothetical protein
MGKPGKVPPQKSVPKSEEQKDRNKCAQLDIDEACKHVANEFGSSDPRFVKGLVMQLIGACQRDGEVSECDLDFLLSVVKGNKPQDQLEAMLLAQMAVIDLTFFENRNNLQWFEYASPRDDSTIAMSKLARTFIMQIDAFKRYRSKGEQNVTVQNVTVSDGGQAIVGDVHQEARAADTPASPHPPALSYSEERPMEPIGQSASYPVLVERKASK